MTIIMRNRDIAKSTWVDMYDTAAVLKARANGYQYAGPAKVATITECDAYKSEYNRLYQTKKSF